MRSKKLIDFKDLQKLSERLRSKKKKIVFTVGSFDLLNPGHCRYLAEAKALGDILVVGVSTDFSDYKLKGAGWPLIAEDIRAELVSYLKTVDFICILDEYRPHAALSLLRPNIYFTNLLSWKDGVRDKQEEYLIKAYNGKIIKRKPHFPYFGTDRLVDHMANTRVIQILESYLKEKIPGFYLDPEKHLKPVDYAEQKPLYENALNANKLVVNFNDLEKLGNDLRKKGKKVVLVSGSYDLLHVGHVRFIEQAGILGDVLVVAIPSDKSLRELKGVGRPIISQNARAYVLGHIDPVDFITIFDEKTVLTCLEKLKPDIFFTVDEAWNNGYKNSPEFKLVKKYGGEIVRVKRQSPFLSSSIIIDKTARNKVAEIFKECMSEERYNKILLEKSKLTENIVKSKNE